MISGLFDKSAEPQFVEKEIVRCIDMAKDGIHAVLVVVSLRSRVSMEEAATIETLQKNFGDKIAEYMILVFTGGDELEEDQDFDDYLSHSETIKVGELSDFIISMNFSGLCCGGVPCVRSTFVRFSYEVIHVFLGLYL